MAIPFYFIGYFFSNQLKTIKNTRSKLYFIPILLIINILITTLNGRVSMYNVFYGHTNLFCSILLFYLNGLVGTLMIVFLSLSVNGYKNFISSISNSLITIVGMQSFFYYFFVKLTHYSFDFFIPFATSIVIMVLCYGFHLLLERYFAWILGKNIQKSM